MMGAVCICKRVSLGKSQKWSGGWEFQWEVRNTYSDEPDALDPLLPLLDMLEVQACFLLGISELAEQALEAAGNDVAMVNVGAIAFLKGSLQLVHDGGFILLNDYGPTTAEAFEQPASFTVLVEPLPVRWIFLT